MFLLAYVTKGVRSKPEVVIPDTSDARERNGAAELWLRSEVMGLGSRHGKLLRALVVAVAITRMLNC